MVGGKGWVSQDLQTCSCGNKSTIQTQIAKRIYTTTNVEAFQILSVCQLSLSETFPVSLQIILHKTPPIEICTLLD